MCAYKYKCFQLLDDHEALDDKNALCLTTFCEVFICQKGEIVKMFFVRSRY